MIVCHQATAVGAISRYQGTIHTDQRLMMTDTTSSLGEETTDSSSPLSPDLAIVSRCTTSPVHEHCKPKLAASSDVMRNEGNHEEIDDESNCDEGSLILNAAPPPDSNNDHSSRENDYQAQSFEMNEEVMDVLQESPFSDTSLSMREWGHGKGKGTTFLDSPLVGADNCLLHEPTIEGSLDDIAALGIAIPSSTSPAVHSLHQKCKNGGKLRLKMFHGSEGRGYGDLGNVAKMNANHSIIVKDQLLEFKSFWTSLSK